MSTAENFISTARDTINSLENRFDIAVQIEHRDLLILCTDAVEHALKAVLMKCLGWTENKARKIISHRLANVFNDIHAPSTIVSQVIKFDNKNWSWVKRYASTCYAAETTTNFPEDPLPVAREIVSWAESEFYK